MRRRGILTGIGFVCTGALAGCTEPNADEAINEPEKILVQTWKVGPSDELGGTHNRLVADVEFQNTESEHTVAAKVELIIDIQGGGTYSVNTEEAIRSASTSERRLEIADSDEFQDEDYNGMLGRHIDYNVSISVGDENRVNSKHEGQKVAEGSNR